MGKKTKIFLIVFGVLFVFYIIGSNENEVKNEQTNSKSETVVDKAGKTDGKENNMEKTEDETVVEEIKELEQSKELTESEYKANCKEVYNDDVFKKEMSVGQLIKVRVMASEKYEYGITDMWGIITEEITDKYNLETNCLGCTVMHESTKDSVVPSYFGEQMYVMFQKDNVLNIDTFKTGQKFILYGEVIQNKNGIFVLPKYYEMEE